MKYSDEQRVKKICENAIALHGYITDNNVQREELLEQKPLQWLVATPLYNMGEHASHLSRQYMEEHGDVPWLMIAGLRHRLLYDYDGANWEIVADVVFEELPQLIESLSRICDGASG